MCKSNRLGLWKRAFVLMVAISVGLACACHAGELHSSDLRCALILDSSGSMDNDEAMLHTKEAAKLGLELLGSDVRIVLIRFGDSPSVSPEFHLATELEEARKWIDSIEPSGGTNYLSALKQLPPDVQIAFLLSDGIPDEQPEEILDFLRQSVTCQLHTIAVQTRPDAEELLREMASVRHGAFHKVSEPERIVDVFLELLGQVRRYSRHEMAKSELTLRDVAGEVVAIGFDASPTLSSASSTQKYEAAFPGKEVEVVRSQANVDELVIGRGSDAASARVVVIRFDLPTPTTTLRRFVSANGPNILEASASFVDGANLAVGSGRLLSVKTQFELLDGDGQVIEAKDGLTADSAIPEARFELSPGSEQQAFVVRTRVVDDQEGVEFESTSSLSIVPGDLPAEEPPKISAKLDIEAQACGRPIEINVRFKIDPKTHGRFDDFQKAILTTPPHLRVTRPDGVVVDSVDSPRQFTVTTARTTANGAEFALEFNDTQQSGEYVATLVNGNVSGAEYSATTRNIKCCSGDEIQLLVHAERQSGRVLLVDSEQEFSRDALMDDPITVSLVRQSMDARVFSSLGRGLRAKLIGRDGAVKSVPLRLENDRYVTSPVVVGEQGVLGVIVEVRLKGLQLTLEGEVRINDVQLEQVFPSANLFAFSHLPKGAVLPFEVRLIGKLTLANRLATSDELIAICTRRGIHQRWTIRDSTAKLVQSDVRNPDSRHWQSTLQFERAGRQNLAFVLTDQSKQVIHEIGWKLTIEESPVHLEVLAGEDSSSLSELPASDALAAWLPPLFTTSPTCFVAGHAADSGFLKHYFLAAVSSNNVDADFDEASGMFIKKISGDGLLEFSARFQPYPFASGNTNALPEIQVVKRLTFSRPVFVRWGRVTSGLGTLFVGCIVFQRLLRSHRIHRLANFGNQIAIWGGNSDQIRPVVDARKGMTEWLLCREASGRHPLVRPSELSRDLTPVARVTQLGDGFVQVASTANLPDLPEGRSMVARYGDQIRVNDSTTLTIEYGDQVLANATS